MTKEELKKQLEEDKVFRKDGGLNTAWIHNRAKNYNLEELEGDTLQEKIYLLYNPRRYCSICGKPTPFINWSTGYPGVCSRECKVEFDRKTLREKAVPKVQSEEAKAKRKQTCIKTYGVDNPFKAKSVQDKIRKTNLTNLGVEHPAQNQGVLNKMRDTNKKNHNNMWSTQTPEHRKLLKENREKVIVEFENNNNCTQVEKLISQYGQGFLHINLPVLQHSRYKFISNEYLPTIQKHYQEYLSHRTHAEQEIYDFCRSIVGEETEILQNTRGIIKSSKNTSLELDIYIPSKKLAIEFNGIYYHSSKDKDYHIGKTEACNQQGIRLLHIWEDLWYYKKDIYKSIIASALGSYSQKIFARQCSCRLISSEEYTTFLSSNHIQGPVKSSLRLGLFFEEDLVQVAGWGKSRFKNGEYELHRMCSKLNTQVVGGFSKLIKHSDLSSFVSYVDRSLYNGTGYISSGFKLVRNTPPGYFYANNKLQRINRLSVQKHKLSKILEIYDSNLTEVENMVKNGYYQLWDCGNLVMEYSK